MVKALRWRDMPRKKRPGTPSILSFKAPAELIAALDAIAEQMSAERKGLRVSRSEAVMILLWEGIERRTSKNKP
jgi:hypothetical protein